MHVHLPTVVPLAARGQPGEVAEGHGLAEPHLVLGVA
jgi:hypothetical protein